MPPAPVSFSDSQIEQVRIAAYTLPRHRRSEFLRRLVELLPAGFDDGDVWRAAHVRSARRCRLHGRRAESAGAGEVTEAAKPA